MMPAFARRTFALFLGLCSGVAALAAQDAGAPRKLPDVPYVTGGSERQRLNLFLPASSDGPARPLVVWVHGGGWETGDRNNCPAAFLVARGYVVASLGYRLSYQAIYPAQIEDCKAAIRFLRAHAEEYGIDPRHVGAWGASAGGHLVALLGTTGHDRRFDVGEHLDQSSAVQCVVDWFGPIDFLHWGEPPVTTDQNTPANSASRLLGGPVSTHLEAARTACPMTYLDHESAPFFIMHGDKDPLVPLQQSQEVDAALNKAGVESTLLVVSGAGHGGAAFFQPENLRRLVAFLDSHLMPK